MKNLLDRLESRFGHLGIPGLVRIIVAFNALVFGLYHVNPLFLDALTLDMGRVMAGEVWRLVSYIFIPPTLSPLWLFFALYLIFLYGEGLERAWGSFRLTVFYLLGMLGTTVAAVVSGAAASNIYLNASLMFAFASLYPDFRLLLFFILPIEIRWVAWLVAGLFVHQAVMGDMAEKLAVAAAFLNYGIFFVPIYLARWREAAGSAGRRRRFRDGRPEEVSGSLHLCAGCGASEREDPDADFRVAADGEEYCAACRTKRRG